MLDHFTKNFGMKKHNIIYETTHSAIVFSCAGFMMNHHKSFRWSPKSDCLFDTSMTSHLGLHAYDLSSVWLSNAPKRIYNTSALFRSVLAFLLGVFFYFFFAKKLWRFLRIVVFPHWFLVTSTAFWKGAKKRLGPNSLSDLPGFSPPSLNGQRVHPTRQEATGESHESCGEKKTKLPNVVFFQDFNDWLKKKGKSLLKILGQPLWCNFFECDFSLNKL